jgi:hypothetical protein
MKSLCQMATLLDASKPVQVTRIGFGSNAGVVFNGLRFWFHLVDKLLVHASPLAGCLPRLPAGGFTAEELGETLFAIEIMPPLIDGLRQIVVG